MRPYLRVANVFEDRIDLSDVMEMHFEPKEVERYELKIGDILLNEGQSRELVGRPAMYRGELPGACFTNSIVRFQASSAVENKYALQLFRHWLKSGAFQSIAQITTNIAHLGAGRFAEMNFPLPPLNEQRRIVAKLDALQERSRRARASLDAVPVLLDKLRQSILAAAFRGDLTRDFREQHKDLEPASKLLQRIRTERRKKWEEAELAKLKAKGKAPTDDKWKAKYKEPDPVDPTGLPTLPDGWCWASVEELTYESSYGTSEKSSDGVDGVPVLGMGNIRDGELVYEKLKTLPRNHPEFPFLLLRSGDLLFNRTNSAELVGKTAVFRGPEPCSFASYLIRLRTSAIEPELIAFFINSPFGRDWVASVVSQQVGQANVNGTKLAALAIPVPSAEERTILIERVSAALHRVKAMRKHVSENAELLTTLDRAILAKAFRGELVPQDPRDEPADELLARVRADQAAPSTPRGRKRAAEAALHD